MSKVVTFSRFFPKHHLRAGEPTHFVEKIWKGLDWMKYSTDFPLSREVIDKLPSEVANYCSVNFDVGSLKFHTIRKGNRWKVGDKFSPRVWSGQPYRSKQITFAPDIEIVKIWNFEVLTDGATDIYLNAKIIANNSFISYAEFGKQNKISEIAANDGLEMSDFASWFGLDDGCKTKTFHGQILCWHKDLEY